MKLNEYAEVLKNLDDEAEIKTKIKKALDEFEKRVITETLTKKVDETLKKMGFSL